MTATTLATCITIGSPTNSGMSPVNSNITHAVTTISNSSNELIVMVHVSRRSAFRFSSCVNSSGRSYPQYFVDILLRDRITADRFEAGVGYVVSFGRML